MKNLEIARILNHIADILELQEVQWKPQAYRKAAQAVEFLTEDIKDIYKRGELEDIPGVGEHIAKKIEEILKTGGLKYFTQLKKQVKVDIEQLNMIPSLGPKKIKILYKKLGVKNVNDLESAIKKGKLETLSGFGKKTEAFLLEGIGIVKSRPKRFLYVQALPIVNEIKEIFSKHDFVQKVEAAGSFRRGRETIGDLDFIAVSNKPGEVMKIFTSLPDVKKIAAKGTTKSSIRLRNGLQVDLRVVKEKEFGSALLYFIGNKQHNIELRKIALRKGYTLSEYGLFQREGKKWVAGRTEEEVYKRLRMQYIPPELRQNRGELQLALQNKLPKLVEKKDVQGVFHNHTAWSDGANSISEMAQKAKQLGLKFISFNDHFGPLKVVNSLDERRLTSYLNAVEKVRKKSDIKIFSGVEIDILKDGSLPLSLKKLRELDVVIAAVHLANKMPEKEMTKRFCHALEKYPVDILGHPTGRLLNQREPVNQNLEMIFQTAKDCGVFLEINGAGLRMDLNGENVRAAKKIGCKFAISDDAHQIETMQIDFGALMSRRGGLEKKDILNCWTLPKIEKVLRK